MPVVITRVSDKRSPVFTPKLLVSKRLPLCKPLWVFLFFFFLSKRNEFSQRPEVQCWGIGNFAVSCFSIDLYWSMVALRRRVSFYGTAKWTSCAFTCPFFFGFPSRFRSAQSTEQCSLCCAVVLVSCFVYTQVVFSPSVVSVCLWPQELQHLRLPCPSPSPGVCSDSCPLSQWCHLTISFSAALFSFCLPSFPASGSFPVDCSSYQVAKVLEFQFQHQFFQWIFKTDFL